MNLITILIFGVTLSIIFHFIGVYANAKKMVWITIALMWIGSIIMTFSEINDKGYESLERLRGKYEATDVLIRAAEPKVRLYEMIGIKKSFNEEKKKQ